MTSGVFLLADDEAFLPELLAPVEDWPLAPVRFGFAAAADLRVLPEGEVYLPYRSFMGLRRDTPSRPFGLECASGDELVRLDILRRSRLDDALRQRRRGRLLVPAALLEPITNELLVKRGLRTSGKV